jgi:hypothetical protein
VGHIAIASVWWLSSTLLCGSRKNASKGYLFGRANGGKQLITGDSDSAENCSVSGAPSWDDAGGKEWW